MRYYLHDCGSLPLSSTHSERDRHRIAEDVEIVHRLGVQRVRARGEAARVEV